MGNGISTTGLSARELAEVERSAFAAKKLTIPPFDPVKIERYLHPRMHATLPLEYAFHLLGDVQGKTVLDLGCGSGENTIPLAKRGAKVIAIDISPDLIELARQRASGADVQATFSVGSAYRTEIDDSSVKVIFCMGVVHHLDIARVRCEMRRILAPDGYIVLKEPIRFSGTYAAIRRFLPAHDNISDAEHPLTRKDLATFMHGFTPHGMRYFRLPFVPFFSRVGQPKVVRAAWHISDWLLRKGGKAVERYATSIVVRLDV